MSRRVALLALFAFLLAGCGRMGAPISPGEALLTAPGNPSLLGRDGGILVSWTAPTKTVKGDLAATIRGYLVERQAFAPGENPCDKCPDQPSTASFAKNTSWFDTGLTPGTTYRYRVLAVDYRQREGLPSAWSEARWAEPPPTPEVKAEGVHQGVLVKVVPPPSTGRKPLGLAVYDEGGKLLQKVPAGVGETVLKGFVNDKPVTLLFRWEEDTGMGWVIESLPLALTVVPRDVEPPEPPTGIAAFAEREGVVLHWIGAPGEPLAEFLVERAEGDGVFAPLASLPGTTIEYLDRQVKPGTVYQYRVIPVDRAGNRGRPSPVARAKGATP